MGTEDTGPLEVAVELWRCACCNQDWQDRLWDWMPGEEGEAEAKEIYSVLSPTLPSTHQGFTWGLLAPATSSLSSRPSLACLQRLLGRHMVSFHT